jgi:hypothetical protein
MKLLIRTERIFECVARPAERLGTQAKHPLHPMIDEHTDLPSIEQFQIIMIPDIDLEDKRRE